MITAEEKRSLKCLWDFSPFQRTDSFSEPLSGSVCPGSLGPELPVCFSALHWDYSGPPLLLPLDLYQLPHWWQSQQHALEETENVQSAVQLAKMFFGFLSKKRELAKGSRTYGQLHPLRAHWPEFLRSYWMLASECHTFPVHFSCYWSLPLENTKPCEDKLLCYRLWHFKG